MNKSPSILAATDLGARSDRAVDRAILLAREWRLRPVIAHVVKPPAADRDIDLFLKTARDALPDPNTPDVEVILPAGPVPQTVVAAAQDESARLIVAAPARLHGPRDYFIGTAVDTMVRLSDLPVLVVKQRPHDHYRRLMIATDLSESSRFALLEAAALFPDAELHLIHSCHISYKPWLQSDAVEKEVRIESASELKLFIDDPAIPKQLRERLSIHMDYGDIDRVIEHALRTYEPDLFVLSTHGKGGFIRAAMGSNAAELLRWVPVDTLMVRG